MHVLQKKAWKESKLASALSELATVLFMKRNRVDSVPLQRSLIPFTSFPSAVSLEMALKPSIDASLCFPGTLNIPHCRVAPFCMLHQFFRSSQWLCQELHLPLAFLAEFLSSALVT